MATDMMSNLERQVAVKHEMDEVQAMVECWFELDQQDHLPNAPSDIWRRELKASTLRELVKKMEGVRKLMEGGWFGFEKP